MDYTQLSSSSASTKPMPLEVIPEKSTSLSNAGRQKARDSYRKKKNDKHGKPHSDQKTSSNKTSTPTRAEDILVDKPLVIRNCSVTTMSMPSIPEELVKKSGKQCEKETASNRQTNRRDGTFREKNRKASTREDVKKKEFRRKRRYRKRASNQMNELSEIREDGSCEPIVIAQRTVQNEISSPFPSVSAPSTTTMTPIIHLPADPDETMMALLSLSPQQEKKTESSHSEKSKLSLSSILKSQAILSDPAIVSLRYATNESIEGIEKNNSEENPPLQPCMDAQRSKRDFIEGTSLDLPPEKLVKASFSVQECDVVRKIRLSNPFRPSKVADQRVTSLEEAVFPPPPPPSSCSVGKGVVSVTPSSLGLNALPPPPSPSSSIAPRVEVGGSRKLRAEAAEFHPSGFYYETVNAQIDSLSSLSRGLNKDNNNGSEGDTPTKPPQTFWHSYRVQQSTKTSSPSLFSPLTSTSQEVKVRQYGTNSASPNMNEAECSPSATILVKRPSLSELKLEFPSAPQTQNRISAAPFRKSPKEACRGDDTSMCSPVNVRQGSLGFNFSPISFSSGNVSCCQLSRCVPKSPFETDGKSEGREIERDGGGGRGCSASPLTERGRDNVRLTHLAIADDVAQNEELMYDLLADADENAEDLEDEILYFEGREEGTRGGGGGVNRFQFSPSSNGDWETRSSASARSHILHESRLGGYWSLDGPRVMEATRLYPPPSRSNRAVTMEGVENAASTYPCTGNPNLPPRTPSVITMDYDDYGDIWKVESSSDEDSLDEEQVQWIEEQLRLNENPKTFF